MKYFAFKAEPNTMIYSSIPGSGLTFVFDLAGRFRKGYFGTMKIESLNTAAVREAIKARMAKRSLL